MLLIMHVSFHGESALLEPVWRAKRWI